MNEKRTWKKVELNKADAEIFRKYLKENDFYYKPSGCFNLIHFEIYVNEIEAKTISNFFKTM